MTEQLVFSGVFGKDGLLAQIGTTIILATHGGKLYDRTQQLKLTWQ